MFLHCQVVERTAPVQAHPERSPLPLYRRFMAVRLTRSSVIRMKKYKGYALHPSVSHLGPRVRHDVVLREANRPFSGPWSGESFDQFQSPNRGSR